MNIFLLLIVFGIFVVILYLHELRQELKNIYSVLLSNSKEENDIDDIEDLFEEDVKNAPAYYDPLYGEAKKIVLEKQSASASLLQRKLRIGFARAAQLIDALEEKGVVGPADGATPREILKNK